MEQMAGDPIQETGCGMHAVQLVRIGTNRLQISCICVNQRAREQIFGSTYMSVMQEERMQLMASGAAYDNNAFLLYPLSWELD